MNLSIIEKIGILFKYIFSSFLSIELLIFSGLLFAILIINMKRKEKLVTYCAIGVYIGLLIGTMIAYHEYVVLCVKEFFKIIVSYICFPTTVAFFYKKFFFNIIIIYSLFFKKIIKFNKI